MNTYLIKIGNSRGVRLPAKLLESLNFKHEVAIEIIDNEGILLKPSKKQPREGWKEAFEKMHTKKDDELLIDDSLDINLISDLDHDYKTDSSI